MNFKKRFEEVAKAAQVEFKSSSKVTADEVRHQFDELADEVTDTLEDVAKEVSGAFGFLHGAVIALAGQEEKSADKSKNTPQTSGNKTADQNKERV